MSRLVSWQFRFVYGFCRYPLVHWTTGSSDPCSSVQSRLKRPSRSVRLRVSLTTFVSAMLTICGLASTTARGWSSALMAMAKPLMSTAALP